jgi:hypothetical protein
LVNFGKLRLEIQRTVNWTEPRKATVEMTG